MSDDDKAGAIDLEQFRMPHDPAAAPAVDAAVKRGRIKKRKKCFVQVPCGWWHQLAKAKHKAVTYPVALHLLFEAWQGDTTESAAVELRDACGRRVTVG